MYLLCLYFVCTVFTTVGFGEKNSCLRAQAGTILAVLPARRSPPLYAFHPLPASLAYATLAYTYCPHRLHTLRLLTPIARIACIHLPGSIHATRASVGHLNPFCLVQVQGSRRWNSSHNAPPYTSMREQQRVSTQARGIESR